jgi:phage terminase small subunit
MKSGNPRKLNAKQTMFIAEYLVDLNASQAAARAGYSKRVAGVIGYQLLQKPLIKAAIEHAQRERLSKLDISADKVVEEIAKVAFFDLTRVVRIDGGRVAINNTDDMSENDRRSLVEISETETDKGTVSKKIRAHDKLKALELLGRHLAMFTDRVEIPGAPSSIILNHYGPLPKVIKKENPKEIEEAGRP